MTVSDARAIAMGVALLVSMWANWLQHQDLEAYRKLTKRCIAALDAYQDLLVKGSGR